jgi:DNA-binding winged helix-turn-helix (wHTH) protein
LSNPNEVVSKNDVLSQVWPDVTVDEGSLRFHMANLRKVLGDGQDGPRSIATVPGRGYCFVAPISRSSDQGQALDAAGCSFPHANLHGRKMGMVGRDDDVFKLSALLNAARFVTIVGSGRETLQVEGQHVYRLDALACPPDDTGITAAVAQTFAAPKLFVERARRRAARTWTSAMRKPQSWSASAPGTRGDASSGGAGCIIDVHARQQRSGACVA